jgi:hypothetical protein
MNARSFRPARNFPTMPRVKLGQGRRGRPLGYRLSEESKRAISSSKRGQRHKQETRDKISRSLLYYFKTLNPLSEELTSMYCGLDQEICEWIVDSAVEIDSIEDVMTIKSLRNARRIEISCGDNIEFFYHEITPELLILFKEQCELTGKDPSELLNSVE